MPSACGVCGAGLWYTVDWSDYAPGTPSIHEMYEEKGDACIDRVDETTYIHASARHDS